MALSTAEAELMACAEAGKQALWLAQLMADMGWPAKAVRLLGDNQATLHMLRNASVSQRSKHIEVRHFFLRDHILAGAVSVEFVASQANMADALTKALPAVKLAQHMRGFGMR